LGGASLLWTTSAAEALAAPVGKGDLVVTTSDGTQVKSEDEVLITLPADTSLVAADVQDDWVLVRVRKDGKEFTGFVQAESVRRVGMVKYPDPHGFSLQYPESWKVASTEHRDEVARRGKEYTQKLPGPAPSPASCIISGPAAGGGNVNCMVSPGSLGEVDDRTAKQFAGEIQMRLGKIAPLVTEVHAELIKVGNKKAISLRFDATFKFLLKEPLRQWEVMIPGKSQTYTFTCSARASDFWRYEPLFAAVIQRIEVDVGGTKP
jgi:hypothetical protein